MIYETISFLLSVNGKWGLWSPYGDCSKSCGSGESSRTRTCDNPAPAHGGTPCVGATSQQQPCNIKPCPGKRVQGIRSYLALWLPLV